MPVRRGVVVAVEGIAGAGKSTIVARASARFGWVPLAEAYDRLDPRPRIGVRTAAALERVERCLLAEEERRYVQARALSARGVTVVADTGFFGPLTYAAGLAALGELPVAVVRRLVARARRGAAAGRWGAPDAVVYLETAAATRRRRRAADPTRHPPRLMARHERVGSFEARFFTATLAAALPGRVHRLRADRAVGPIVGDLGRTVRRLRPLDGAAAAPRLLDLLWAGVRSDGRSPRTLGGNR